jgi:pimeloyl-ACP methyl ester carboxylesterase
MGGLVALHLALLRPDRVAALALIAPALGFAARRWERLSDAQRAHLRAGGRLSLNTAAKDDAVGLEFYSAAARFDLPAGPGAIPLRCPVRILHGGLDAMVPLAVSRDLADQISHGDVSLQVVKDAAHAFAAPRDLEVMQATVTQLVVQLRRQAKAEARPEPGPEPEP